MTINITQGGNLLKRMNVSLESAFAFRDALLYLGVPDRGGYFDLDEVIAAWKSLGPDSDSADKAFNDLVYYFQKRRERGLDVIENLAAEVCELARWVRMPNKLVRDKSGRSIGTQKVPGLGKLH